VHKGRRPVNIEIKRRWRKYTPPEPETLPLGTPEERVVCLERALAVWDERMDHPTYELFHKFVDVAKEDLRSLASQGGNPVVILDILIPRCWRLQDAERGKWLIVDGEIFPSSLRKLSSPDYWKAAKARLLRTRRFLKELLSYIGGLDVSAGESFDGDNPLGRIVWHAYNCDEAIGRFLATLNAYPLCEEGWEWKRSRYGVMLGATEKRGVKRGGRSRERLWAIPAAMLHCHVKKRTGKPHWGTVVRLLHFVGFEDFPSAIPREGERMSGNLRYKLDERWKALDLAKKGVAFILSDPKNKSAITSEVGRIEQRFEVVCVDGRRPLRTRLAFPS